MNLAIKGHATRGKEVIEILEMLGGKNVCNYGCDVTSYIYSIDVKGTINWYIPHPDSPLAIFSLEEFIKKFPYKVGDKVKSVRINNLIGRITNVRWHSNENQIIYIVEWNDVTTSTLNYFARGLQPYKEETMEEPKELLIGFTKDEDGNMVLNTHKDYEIKEVGGKFMLLKKKPQYPKTYEECAKVLLERASVRNDIGYKGDLIVTLQKLLVCRDAYWKIAGWNPQVKGEVFYIHSLPSYLRDLLPMPTVEMRDAFLENFKKLIEHAKELL